MNFLRCMEVPVSWIEMTAPIEKRISAASALPIHPAPGLCNDASHNPCHARDDLAINNDSRRYRVRRPRKAEVALEGSNSSHQKSARLNQGAPLWTNATERGSTHALSALEIGEHEGTFAAHLSRVALHYVEGRAHHRREVDLVDDEKIGSCDAGAALARNLVPRGHVDHVERQVGQLGG